MSDKQQKTKSTSVVKKEKKDTTIKTPSEVLVAVKVVAGAKKSKKKPVEVPAVPVVVEVPVAPVEVPKKKQKVEKKQFPSELKSEPVIGKKHKSKHVNILMSVPRVRKFMDKYGVNKHYEHTIESLIKSKTEESKLSAEDELVIKHAYESVYVPKLSKFEEYKTKVSKGLVPPGHKIFSKFVIKTESIDEKLDYVNKNKYRFSGDSATTMAVVLEHITNNIVKSAIINTVTSERSIVTIESVFSESSDKTWFPLFQDLDEFKKSKSSVIVDDKAEDDSKDDGKETSLDFYVTVIFKSVRSKLALSDKKYEAAKMGKKFREFSSQILLQLINRYNVLFKLCSDYYKCKTITGDTVMFITKMLMVDSGVVDNTLFDYVSDKLSKK